MANHIVKISLDSEQEEFLKWLAKRDRISVKDELERMIYTEFGECQSYFEEERNKETEAALLPEMLWQYLYGDTYGICDESEELSEERLLDYAEYVKSLDKKGEWWGFSMYGSKEKSIKQMRSDLTRFITKLRKKIKNRAAG